MDKKREREREASLRKCTVHILYVQYNAAALPISYPICNLTKEKKEALTRSNIEYSFLSP